MLLKRYASAQELDGVINLERLRSGSSTSLERDAAGFLELTYPSSDVHALVRGLSSRFDGGSQSGTILAHSAKGLGKSHALLLGYHLFSSPETARAWVEPLGYDWAPPGDTPEATSAPSGSASRSPISPRRSSRRRGPRAHRGLNPIRPKPSLSPRLPGAMKDSRREGIPGSRRRHSRLSAS